MLFCNSTANAYIFFMETGPMCAQLRLYSFKICFFAAFFDHQTVFERLQMQLRIVFIQYRHTYKETSFCLYERSS
jgi:hypothetical protein